jgi:hemoglobin
MKEPSDGLVPNLNPAAIPGPNREIYGLMGRDNIYCMLEDFYRELEKSSIRDMFPADMVAGSQKSAAFFVQLLGGPSEYNERFGPPRMRARHMPFKITSSARNVWLDCFDRVLAHAVRDYGFPEQHLADFRRFLEGFSQWMVNSHDEPARRLPLF